MDLQSKAEPVQLQLRGSDADFERFVRQVRTVLYFLASHHEDRFAKRALPHLHSTRIREKMLLDWEHLQHPRDTAKMLRDDCEFYGWAP